MAADGGPAERRTYLGANSAVRGWTRDGRIVFQTDARTSNRGETAIYTVGATDGTPVQVPVGPANELNYAPDGQGVVLGRNTVDPARWKRYRGGTRGDIWIDAAGRGSFKRLVNINGNLASPLWVGDRIYFLSDHEGIGNLYSVTPTGRSIRRHTDHDTYYARWAYSDGERIVYQLAAEIWIFDPATGDSRRVDVDLRSPRIGRNRRFVDASRYLHSWGLHPDGSHLALATRGKLFTMPNWEHAPRQYGERDGVRYRLPRFTFDGASVVCVSDEAGEEALEVFSTTDGSRTKRLDRVDIGRALELQPSPTKNQIVLTNHRNELVFVDIQTNRSRVLDSSDHAQITGPAWSPDGRYVAYSISPDRRTAVIRIADVANGNVETVTRPDFADFAPSFDPDGRYLYFLSYRVFDPVYDPIYFDLSFPRMVRPHLVTLRVDEASPFIPKPRPFNEKPPKDEPPKKGAASDKPKSLAIDFDAIDERVVAFPVPEGRYTQIRGLKDKVLFASLPVSGALGAGDDESEEAKGKIEIYDLKELKSETLVQGAATFSVSQDDSTLLYRAGGRLRAIRADNKPDDGAGDAPGRKSGWIDLNRVRVSVDPATEYRQMFREAWRFQREHFWVPDMSGVDWVAIYERYRPLVEKVGTRYEFSDLMWEMNGELGTSHAYEMGGDLKPAPPYRVGHLGIDVELRNKRWVITHIVRGDSWDPSQTSPMAAPGIDAKEGDVILAINGQAATPEHSPAWLLVNYAGTDVEVVLANAQGRAKRTVYVRTLVDDKGARYREWVERNRTLVHDRTRGRVGYVHIPDMGPHGYAEFHRYYNAEIVREGLIVDVRYNGGGHVSQIILEKLARERIGYDVTRWSKTPDPYPSDSPNGPLVCITNEQAGSDGDIFTHAFKLMGLGPVVGKRTWGGVVGINYRHQLVDNGMTTQPEFSYWFKDVGWGVENYGTDPTHDVDITPQDYAAGRDPQMDTALRLMNQALAKHKEKLPDLKTRPKLTLPKLPKR
jgi:tricorn protease